MEVVSFFFFPGLPPFFSFRQIAFAVLKSRLVMSCPPRKPSPSFSSSWRIGGLIFPERMSLSLPLVF